MSFYARDRDDRENSEPESYSSDSECNGDVEISEYDADELESESEPDEPPGEESPSEHIHGDKQQPKRRRYTEGSPVTSILSADTGGLGGQVTPRARQRAVNPRTQLSLSAGQTPVQRNHAPIRPKSLDTRRCDSESLSVALGNITNMLGTVIERLDKTESKLESIERKINSPLSSSATSGAEAKRKIPTIVRVSVFPCIE